MSLSDLDGASELRDLLSVFLGSSIMPCQSVVLKLVLLSFIGLMGGCADSDSSQPEEVMENPYASEDLWHFFSE